MTTNLLSRVSETWTDRRGRSLDIGDKVVIADEDRFLTSFGEVVELHGPDAVKLGPDEVDLFPACVEVRWQLTRRCDVYDCTWSDASGWSAEELLLVTKPTDAVER